MNLIAIYASTQITMNASASMLGIEESKTSWNTIITSAIELVVAHVEITVE